MFEVWFVISIAEFGVIMYLLASIIHEQKALQNGKPDVLLTSQAGRVGVVKNYKIGILVIGNEVTTFEIHELNGDVFYAALNGYKDILSENDHIEFWPSDTLGAYKEIEKETKNPDGTTIYSVVGCRYYKLEKYRILAKNSVP